MALDIDGFAVLRSIGSHRSVFPDIVVEATKAARALVVKQITAKNLPLKSLRGVSATVGADAFDLILDGMPDTQIKALLGRLDKNHPELRTSNPQWRRERVRALVTGGVEPTVGPVPKPQKRKNAPPRQPDTLELISYRSAGAKRRR